MLNEIYNNLYIKKPVFFSIHSHILLSFAQWFSFVWIYLLCVVTAGISRSTALSSRFFFIFWSWRNSNRIPSSILVLASDSSNLMANEWMWIMDANANWERRMCAHFIFLSNFGIVFVLILSVISTSCDDAFPSWAGVLLALLHLNGADEQMNCK